MLKKIKATEKNENKKDVKMDITVRDIYIYIICTYCTPEFITAYLYNKNTPKINN